jgi:hypothetical protein
VYTSSQYSLVPKADSGSEVVVVSSSIIVVVASLFAVVVSSSERAVTPTTASSGEKDDNECATNCFGRCRSDNLEVVIHTVCHPPCFVGVVDDD